MSDNPRHGESPVKEVEGGDNLPTKDQIEEVVNSKILPLEEAKEVYNLTTGAKLNTYKKMLYYSEELKTARIRFWKELEYNLAIHYTTLGWHDEAEVIVEKYLKQDDADLDFLQIKMNIERGRGNGDDAEAIRATICKISPKVLE